ncbi:hypothetical protein [Nocardia sp. NPDC050793]|uniref:hypothetical protein n=1 Tax=Nocardia sp. NPDC050793 TaxID=3155159 RepID=UPI0033D00532
MHSGAAARSDSAPAFVPTPFAAAVAAAKDKATGAGYVVGDEVNDDLVLARTLLGAVLAAVDGSVVGLSWAVAVMRGPSGTGVFITSNEGRGWLPAGLFLPHEVSTPWLWDEVLGADDGDGRASVRWEGISDPARILVEFAEMWGPLADARLSALASSGPIDSSLRARLDEVAVAGMVGPTFDIDLRVPASGTADRLRVAGSAPALENAAAVEDSRLRQKCIELAVQAHERLGQGPPAAAEARIMRERILAVIQAGEQVPSSWWEELRDADHLLAAAMVPRRADVGRVELGQLRADSADPVLSQLVFERRCDELVLLLEGEQTRQHLRDATYAHDQIVRHPIFAAAPVQVSVGDTRQVGGAASSGGVVIAPSDTVPPPIAVADRDVTGPRRTDA